MKIADMLNPSLVAGQQLSSPPLSPEQNDYFSSQSEAQNNNNGKPRSRFSDIEDAIICEGVAKGLTWGQISGQLPHRKRATCFNRYRTLQGVRKSRKRSVPELIKTPPITPPYSSSSWLPSPKQHQMPSMVAPLPRLSTFLYDRIH